MQSLKSIFIISVTIWYTLFFVACSEDDSATPEPVETAMQVNLADDGTLGKYLVNQDGRALYFFSHDVNGSSACEDGCLDAWPVYNQGNLEFGSGLSSEDFGAISREDGQQQTTYKGWPLYYYSGDSGAGEINGEGIGRVWFVAKPDYTLMLANQKIEGIESDPISYLVDARGNSLYYFLNDAENLSNCVDACLLAWPVFSEVADIVLPSALSEGDFSVITRTDGIDQLTYAGRPVYFFAQDNERGDTNGASVPNWTISQLPQ